MDRTEIPNRDPTTVQLGDIVQYVWGMPGPDYSEGVVSKLHDDGSFDIAMGPETFGGPMTYERTTLSDRNERAGIGYCAKVTRPGVNGF